MNRTLSTMYLMYIMYIVHVINIYKIFTRSEITKCTQPQIFRMYLSENWYCTQTFSWMYLSGEVHVVHKLFLGCIWVKKYAVLKLFLGRIWVQKLHVFKLFLVCIWVKKKFVTAHSLFLGCISVKKKSYNVLNFLYRII